MVEKKIDETKQGSKLENTNTDFTYQKRHAIELSVLCVQMRGQNAGEQNKIPEKNLVIPAHDPATDSVADRVRSVRPRWEREDAQTLSPMKYWIDKGALELRAHRVEKEAMVQLEVMVVLTDLAILHMQEERLASLVPTEQMGK